MTVRRSGLALLAMLLLPAPAPAQWTAEQLGTFTKDCVDGCRNNKTIAVSKRSRCEDYCHCVSTEGQRRFSAADYRQMDADSQAEKDTPKLREFKTLFQPCMRGTIQ